MTRRSQRELERALEELDIQTSERETTTEIEEHCSEDVVEFVYGLARDLLRISWHNADEVENETEPEATLNYLLLVREQYDEIPPRFEYELTDEGAELAERLQPLMEWLRERE